MGGARKKTPWGLTTGGEGEKLKQEYAYQLYLCFKSWERRLAQEAPMRESWVKQFRSQACSQRGAHPISSPLSPEVLGSSSTVATGGRSALM